MAGIDTMTPYRDPREELRRAVLGSRAGQPSTGPYNPRWTAVSPGAVPAAAAPAMAPVAAAAEAIPVREASQASRAAVARARLNSAIPSATIRVPNTGIGGALVRGAGTVAGAVGKASPVLGGIGEVALTTRDALTPGMTGMDQAGRVAEGAGRIGGMGVGALGGAAIGALTGPAAPIAVPALATLGGIGGYFAPDAAMKAYNWATGNKTQLASDKAADLRGPAQVTQAAAPAVIDAMPAQPYSNEGRNYPASPGAAAAPQPNQITFDPKTKTYSGTDVKAGAEITGGIGGGRGTGRGTVTVLDTSEGRRQDELELQRLVAERQQREAGQPGFQPSGGLSGIGDSATAERNANFDRNTLLSKLESVSRLGSGRERQAALQAMATLSAQPMPYDAQQARDQQTATARRGQDIGAMTQRDVAGIQGGNQRDIATIQGANQRDVANIGADSRTSAAETAANARALAAEAAARRYTPINLGEENNADGTKRNLGTALLDNQTREIVYPGAQGGKPAAPTAGSVVEKGGAKFRFKGGDPSKPESWEKV